MSDDPQKNTREPHPGTSMPPLGSEAHRARDEARTRSCSSCMGGWGYQATHTALLINLARRSDFHLLFGRLPPLGCRQTGASSGGFLAAPWAIARCFSANASAASLFENVAITCPLALSSLTSNLAPSWVTIYVLMPLPPCIA